MLQPPRRPRSDDAFIALGGDTQPVGCRVEGFRVEGFRVEGLRVSV